MPLQNRQETCKCARHLNKSGIRRREPRITDMTEEFKKLLDRDFSRVAVKPIVEIASPLLRELVNHALMAFRRCEVEAAAKGGENEDVAALLLYRHIIEMADGIEVLIAESCGTAAIPVLRSEFEASLALSYLLEQDAAYVQRALSWLVSNMHAAIKARRVLEPGTQPGKEYGQLYEKEFGRAFSAQPTTAIAAEIQSIEMGLQNVQFAPIEAEFQRTRKALGRVPEWFALFDGPKNRAELAERLGRGAEYRLLYSDWSTLGHANDMHRYLSTLGGKPAFDAVRRPDELQQIALLAVLLLARATRGMINKFRRGENLETWYLRDVKPLLDGLVGLTITFSPLPEA